MKHDANLNRCQEVQVFKTKKQADSATGKAGTVRSQDFMPAAQSPSLSKLSPVGGRLAGTRVSREWRLRNKPTRKTNPGPYYYYYYYY